MVTTICGFQIYTLLIASRIAKAESKGTGRQHQGKISSIKEPKVMLEEYPDVLTVDEVCSALRIGYNRVYELLNSGSLNGYRNGRTWRIPKLAVEQYIMRNSKLTV